LRLRRIAALLDNFVPSIPRPIPELEQYTTPSELALRVAYELVRATGPGATFADLGAGTCRLSLALLLLGAYRVIAIELDSRLCPLCIEAALRAGVEERLGIICSRITRSMGPLSANIDGVVMNPPYGVWRRGADREFIEYALSLRPEIIIAILKAGNYSFHARIASGWGYKAFLLWRDSIEIPASMPHHRSRIRRVSVDVIAFKRK
jgi:putative methylase